MEATLFGAKTLNKDRRVLQEVGFSEASRDNLETASFGNPDSSLRFGAGGERGQWSGTLPAYLSGSSTLLQTQALPRILPVALCYQPHSPLAHGSAVCKEILYRSSGLFSIFKSHVLVLKHFLCKLCTFTLTLASDNYFVSSVKTECRCNS